MSPRHYTVDPMLLVLPLGNSFKCHEKVLYLKPMIPPKRFDIFPPDWGMLRRSRCVRLFFKRHVRMWSYMGHGGQRVTLCGGTQLRVFKPAWAWIRNRDSSPRQINPTEFSVHITPRSLGYEQHRLLCPTSCQ